MSIFVMKSTCAYLWLFAILSVVRAGIVPCGSVMTSTGIIREILLQVGMNFCLLPPQPSNGGWKLHPQSCASDLDCDLSGVTFLKKGGQLIYSCDSGYRLGGNPVVHCMGGNEWTAKPNCIRSVGADTIANSSMRTTTATSSHPTEEEKIDSLGNGDNYSKMDHSESSNRREKRNVGKVAIEVGIGAGTTFVCTAGVSAVSFFIPFLAPVLVYLRPVCSTVANMAIPR